MRFAVSLLCVQKQHVCQCAVTAVDKTTSLTALSEKNIASIRHTVTADLTSVQVTSLSLRLHVRTYAGAEQSFFLPIKYSVISEPNVDLHVEVYLSTVVETFLQEVKLQVRLMLVPFLFFLQSLMMRFVCLLHWFLTTIPKKNECKQSIHPSI